MPTRPLFPELRKSFSLLSGMERKILDCLGDPEFFEYNADIAEELDLPLPVVEKAIDGLTRKFDFLSAKQFKSPDFKAFLRNASETNPPYDKLDQARMLVARYNNGLPAEKRFTEDESNILAHGVAGLDSHKRIAWAIGVSQATVRTHLQNVFEKVAHEGKGLQLVNMVALIRAHSRRSPVSFEPESLTVQ